MKLILNSLEKGNTFLGGGIVVNTGGVNIGNFLIKTAFRGSDVLDATEEFFKIIKGMVRVLQAFVIKHKAFNNELPKLLRGPDAEARGNMAFDPVAHRDNHVQIIIFQLALNLTGSLLLNCQNSFDSCL